MLIWLLACGGGSDNGAAPTPSPAIDELDAIVAVQQRAFELCGNPEIADSALADLTAEWNGDRWLISAAWGEAALFPSGNIEGSLIRALQDSPRC